LFADHVQSFGKAFDECVVDTSLGSASKTAAAVPLKASRRSTGNNTLNTTIKSTATRMSLEEESDALLQKKAVASANDRQRRKTKSKIQTEYILNESRQESFSRYQALFEDKFDQEVKYYFIHLFCHSFFFR
jgi:hypothetical protein